MTKRHDTAYVKDIRSAAQLALDFIKGVTREQFETDLMRQSAVIRQLEVIGEASRQLSAEFRNANPQVPWSDMIGMRNILIHVYHEMDLDIVWKTLQSAIPALLSALKP